jgi:N-acetyl-gamma-glutamylphosphate reductase
MKKIRIGIVGVSGYAGLELIALVLKHPAAGFVAAMDAGEIGEVPLQEIHPRLAGVCTLTTFVPEEPDFRARAGYSVFMHTGYGFARSGSQASVAGNSGH